MRIADALAHLDAFLERVHPGYAEDDALHDAARALSEAYTTGRAVAPDAAGSVAYLAHFGPRAVVAAGNALASVRVPGMCVDVGAGSGAGALALAFSGARRVTLVEQSTHALALATRLLAGLCDVRSVSQRLEDARPVDAELLLSTFTFGELTGTPMEAFEAVRRVSPQARISVLVDAGDRARARRLQELRDHLAATDATILAPCPHREPCPALVRPRDWCHARWPKDLPERLARFSRAVGRDDERMAASYLVVGDGPPAEPSLLVIGEAHKEKGRARVPVCGPGGLRFLQALKRDREAHDALLALPRGARVPASAVTDVRDHTGHVSTAVVALPPPTSTT